MSSYFPPNIDSSGLHLPAYSDVIDNFVENAQSIYGSDIYIENDAADYQLLSILARALNDALQTAQMAYNSRSPLTSIGVALDSIVKLNGLIRKAASYSTCQITLTGTAGTAIDNGVVQDVNGVKWDLPAVVTIPVVGTITVSAVCETIGDIAALAGTLNQIATPTSGWISVTNSNAAVLGQPAESDSLLRSRQAISTKLPSLTLLDGTKAAIAALSSVTRWQVYENYTNVIDINGLNPHSIWAVVEGDIDDNIANAIYYNKSIGCGLNGTTTVQVTDVNYGTVCNVSFSRPTYVPIYVNVSVKLLTGGSSAYILAIQAAIANYLNDLQIGENVTISGLYGAAMAIMPNLLVPVFSITSLTAGRTLSPAPSTTDITIAFNEVAESVVSPASVVVTSV